MQAESRKVQGTGASDESLLPELLHALSQPLTALRCSLELTLLQLRNSEEYRKRLRESLDLTEETTTLAAGIRELLEVEQPSSREQRVVFDKILQTTVRELLPVANSMGVGVSMPT
jgi:signal transduction histidine kinase